MQLLDTGFLTDSTGRRVSFRSCVVILTTNAVASKNAACGFSGGIKPPSPRDGLSKVFSFELMNRLDAVCAFRKLSSDDCEEIAKMRLSELSERAARQGITLELSPELAKAVASLADYETFGARDISRVISEKIENPLADMLLSGGSGRVRVSPSSGEIVIEAESFMSA